MDQLAEWGRKQLEGLGGGKSDLGWRTHQPRREQTWAAWEREWKRSKGRMLKEFKHTLMARAQTPVAAALIHETWAVAI